MEVVVNLRSPVAVSYGRKVIGVDHLITVDILVLDVARAHGREVLHRAGGDVRFVFEEADGLHAVDLSDAATCTDEILVHARFFELGDDLVAVEVEVPAESVLEAAGASHIVDADLSAPAVHDASVLVRGVLAHDCRILARRAYPDV